MIAVLPSIVAGKLMIEIACRSHRGSHTGVTTLVLLIIVRARSIAKSTMAERIYRNQFLSFSLLIDASLNTVDASL
jgi:cadmium resistance protein CadD (predicted permease)